jgi:ribulose 1,5-bisphosphate synthetase/thiazole synthase
VSQTWSYRREIPVEPAYDVVVAGGGPAGTAAAIAAARAGAKVLLVEATGALGGMSSNGLVANWYCLSDGNQIITRGLFWEIVRHLRDAGGLRKGLDPDTLPPTLGCGFGYSAETLKRVLDSLVIDAGVDLLLTTRLIDVDVDRRTRKIAGVVIHHVEGVRYVAAKAFIDATGDAVLADLCGVKYREAGRDNPNIMPPTLCATCANIDWTKFNHRLQQEMVEKAVDEGFFSQPDKHVPGLFRSQESYGIQNAGHLFRMNAVKVRSLTAGHVKGRKLAAEYAAFFRKYMPGCENLELVGTATLMGVREARNIDGEYELNYDDFKARRQFDDQVGVYAKGVDIHVYDLTPEEYQRYYNSYVKRDRLKAGECYGLPYGILVPRGWTNLWAAGRCVSSDVEVHGAIRDQPACYMLGEAAGLAAVQSIRTGQPACDLDVATLVQTLRGKGAYLPQAKLPATMTRA